MNAAKRLNWILVYLSATCCAGAEYRQRTKFRSGGAAQKCRTASLLHDRTPQRPLRVMLIPADGGTEEGTRADFEPVFAAITREYGLHFGHPPVVDDARSGVLSTDLQQRGLQFRCMLRSVRMAGTWT